MWWMYLELIPHQASQLWSYDKNGFNSLVNTLFWCSSFTFVTFFFFSKFLEVKFILCLNNASVKMWIMFIIVDRDSFDRKKCRYTNVHLPFDLFGTWASTRHAQRSYIFTINISLHREFWKNRTASSRNTVTHCFCQPITVPFSIPYQLFWQHFTLHPPYSI